MTTIKYPLSIRSILAANYSRKQSAEFVVTESRSGKIYTKKAAANQPSFMDVLFKFSSDEAAIFQSWFRHTLQMGFHPFLMKINTEWGDVEYECQFMPDSLIPTTKEANIWIYSAQIMVRDYGPPVWVPPDIVDFHKYYLERSLLDVVINTQLNKCQ